MGLFSYFLNRRARESAIPGSQVSLDTRTGATEGTSAMTEINGLGDIGALLSQFQQFQQGGMQVNDQVIDLRGSGLREEILGALAQHGVDASNKGSQIDASSVPGLQNDILAALGRHGLNPGAVGVERVPGEAGSLPEATAASPDDGPQIKDPLAGQFGGQQIPGVGDMGDLGAMIQNALQQGNATVHVNGQVVDLREGGMEGGMFDALDLGDTSADGSSEDKLGD